MRNIISGVIVGLVIGIVLGVTILTPKIKKHSASGAVVSERDLEAGAADTPLPLPALNDGEVITFKSAPAYPTDRPNVLKLGKEYSEKLARLSGDKMLLPTPAPREVIPRRALFTAIAAGRIHALFATADIAIDEEPSLAIFTGIPFGPETQDYMSWIQTGGGQEKLADLFSKHNIHPIVCGFLPPASAGWFKERIRNVEEMKSLRIRAHGFGADVWKEMGAEVVRMPGEEIRNAFDGDQLDGAVFSSPDIDSQLDFNNFADFYYYPSWQSSGQPLLLLVNARNWRRLSQEHQLLMTTICAEHTADAIQKLPSLLYEGISEVGKKGVSIEKMPGFALAELRKNWEEVLAHKVRQSPEFRESWDQFKRFMSRRETWKALNTQKDEIIVEEDELF